MSRPSLLANQLCPPCGAQDFFNDLAQDKTELFIWKKGMVAEINRLIFLRSLHEPKGQDTTEHEIVLEHVQQLCAAFARAGTDRHHKEKRASASGEVSAPG